MTEWQDDDEVTTTFGTLKQAQAEAAEAERARIVALLEGEVWDAPEIAESYVRHIVALIKGEAS
jgi:hypothetical protein